MFTVVTLLGTSHSFVIQRIVPVYVYALVFLFGSVAQYYESHPKLSLILHLRIPMTVISIGVSDH